jgi:uncharacterized protein
VEQQEKRMIEELFGKLQQAESQSGPREAEAEALIRDAVAKQPAAPYYMAQAILVQENALENLNQRVRELEQELANRPAGGGFLGGLFGGGATSSPAANRSVSGQPIGSNPAANSPAMGMNPAQQRGGGFMGSALQTAVAVAGGVMLANAVTGMFASEEASAAEASPEDEPLRNDFGQDEGGFDDGGGFDDFGDF